MRRYNCHIALAWMRIVAGQYAVFNRKRRMDLVVVCGCGAMFLYVLAAHDMSDKAEARQRSLEVTIIELVV